MLLVIGDEIAQRKAVGAAHIVDIAVYGRDLQEFVQELLHDRAIALYKAPDQIREPAAAGGQAADGQDRAEERRTNKAAADPVTVLGQPCPELLKEPRLVDVDPEMKRHDVGGLGVQGEAAVGGKVFI